MTDSKKDPGDPGCKCQGHEVAESLSRTEPLPGEGLGGALFKALTDTAFAVVGVAATVADRSQQFYEEQREQAKRSGDEASVEYLVFVQAPDQVRKVAIDLARGYQDMAEKGRQRVLRAQADLDEDLATSSRTGETSSNQSQENPEES